VLALLPPPPTVPRPLVGRWLACALAALCASCSLLRDYATYQRILQHEREYADVEIARYDLRVELSPEEGRADVAARLTLRNGRRTRLERVQLLLASTARVRAARCGATELSHRTQLQSIGGFASNVVDIAGLPPVEAGGEREIELEYTLTSPPAELGLRIEPEHGYLLGDGLWAPILRTPLSESGMDRAPATIEVALPAALQPVGIAEFVRVGSEGSTCRYRAASTFPFAPFFAYGRYTRVDDAGANARVFLLDPASSERSREFVLDALAELRAHFERAFGPVELGPTQLAVVKRSSSSWGAPCCILMDECMWPHDGWREPATFEVLAHELSHSWWGTKVSMHSRGGYAHEGLANWCCADAVRARSGDVARERAFEAWMVRYARTGKPFGRALRDVSILEGSSYQTGAYLVGAHFYRAVEERLGRERFVALLRRFGDELAFQSADFEDLRAVAQRECGNELDELFERWVDSRRGGDELYERGRALLDERMAYWRARDPTPSDELRARIESVLADAFERSERAGLAERAAPERAELARTQLGSLSAMPYLQVTVIDAAAQLVFHCDGLTGDVRGHSDVRGASVYGAIADETGASGSLANFDFTSNDLRAARENFIAWRKLGELAVIVEGHEWRAME
jgi:hypothetical protein